MKDAAVLPERFRDAEPLGAGAQGVTFKAFDTKLGRIVATKLLQLGRVQDWKEFERFERECKVLASIEHPGVPRYLDHYADEDAGIYVLVMELVEGRSLASDIADQRRRTQDQLVDLLDRLLAILQALHELHPRVIHRDIKPGNVIQRPDGSVALVDFGGVARPFAAKGTSVMVGTAGYMAPEQLYGKASVATDLYAVGATLAAVAAGVEGVDLPRQGHAIDLGDIVPEGRLRTTLEVLLAADPQDRAASAADARRLLSGAIDRASLPAPRSEGSALARREQTRSLLPASPRQRAVVIGSVIAAAVASAITRSPLVLLSVVAVMLLAVAIKLGRGSG